MKHVPYRPIKVPYKEPVVVEGAIATGCECVRYGRWEALGGGSLLYWVESGLNADPEPSVTYLPRLTLLQTLSLLYKLPKHLDANEAIEQIVDQFCGGIE